MQMETHTLNALEPDTHTNATETAAVCLLLCCWCVPEQVFTASVLANYGQSKDEVVVTEIEAFGDVDP